MRTEIFLGALLVITLAGAAFAAETALKRNDFTWTGTDGDGVWTNANNDHLMVGSFDGKYFQIPLPADPTP